MEFRPPPPPPPDNQTWYSGQFQFNNNTSLSPSPNQHWAPPPPPPPQPPPQSSYHAPPYPAQHSYPPPQPPNRSLHPHSYPPPPPPQLNQEWHHSGWNHNQGLQYPANNIGTPVHNNGEDWAAKAREWAAAHSSSDNQYPQAQYASVGRIEENTMSNPQYTNGQHSSYQHYQPSIAPPYQSSEPSFSTGYVPDNHLPFNGRNGSLGGESNAAFPHQESSPSSSSVHQQEVPSSYSSVAGKEDFTEQNQQFYKSPWAFSSTAQQQAQPAAVHGTVSMEQPHYAFSNQSADPPSDPSDQPLEFVHGFSRDHEQRVQSAYSQNSGLHVRGTDSPAVGSIHSWNATTASGVAYPPVHAPGSQVDPSLALPSPVPGHSGQLFGRISGQNFQPMGPSVVPFGGAGAFPGDGFVASGVPDRPKKPSVPNWLREELIKNKSVITTSAPEFSEDTKSVEEETINKSFVKGDQDSKSIDSSRSTEEEDDEEDDVEIARTAAINHEIKRILTEVLLKVTDELFDEIATKVLSEEGSSISRKDHEVSTPAPAVPVPKASAKVLITAKPGEDENDLDDTGKLTLSAPGDLLGLGSYATDDDEDDDTDNIRSPNSRRNTTHQSSTIKIYSDNISVAKNDLSNTKDTQKNNSVLESHPGRMYSNGSSDNFKPDNKPISHGSGKEYMHGNLGPINSFKTDISLDDHGVNNGAEVVSKADISMLKDNIEKSKTKTELSIETVGAKGTSDNTEVGEARIKPVKNDKYDRKGSPGKDIVKEARDDRRYVGGYESNRRQEERKVKKERTDDRDSSKEKSKVHDRSAEKSVDADSKRRSSHRDKKEIVETEKDGRTRGEEGYERKRDRTKDERGERSRDKDSSRHKRRRSSSVGSRGRDRKNQEVVSRTKDSSDEESGEDSKRKSRSRKEKSSQSPVRSRRRQVSRSPHSKHSRHRHSPYSSIETTRGKRSRSRSPARRKR